MERERYIERKGKREKGNDIQKGIYRERGKHIGISRDKGEREGKRYT